MMQSICIWTIIFSPAISFVYSIIKEANSNEKDKSPGIVAAFVVVIATYVIYHFAGVFTLLK